MTESCDTCQPPDHKKELSRLNRISGQIEGVKKMIDERRYCPDIIAQLRAIASATKSLEASLLETHLDSCVRDAFDSGNSEIRKQKISELVKLFKRYE